MDPTDLRLATEIAAKLHPLAIETIKSVLNIMPIEETDQNKFDQLNRDSQNAGHSSYFDFSLLNGTPLTAAMWANYFRVFVLTWNGILGEATREKAKNLPDMRRKYAIGEDETRQKRLLDAIASTLARLGETSATTLVNLRVTEAFALAFFELAKAVEEAGNPDIAYNVMMIVLSVGPEEATTRELTVRYALSLAQAANRPHQIAACSAKLVEVLLLATNPGPERQLEIFDTFEAAFEHLRLSPEAIRAKLARLLLAISLKENSLAMFSAPLVTFLPRDERSEEVLKGFGEGSWPNRVATQTMVDWFSQQALRDWEMNFDLRRLELTPKPIAASATTDWVSWVVDHPAFRRVVPHNRSFVREAHFDSLLLVLTHEITHVLSLMGSVGIALNCLRMAAFDAESAMWSVTPGTTIDNIVGYVGEFGHAPIVDGQVASLMRAEQGLELTLKAQMLQDVWTSWFEGLAVFGEVAADPKLDSVRIGHISYALRNLVDSQWQVTAGLTQFTETFANFAAKFEAQCSAAIARRGPTRLRGYLRRKDVPYFAGYIAVRSIAAAWRARSPSILTGTEAFNLLLHATRLGTTDAVPDLSLRSDLFLEAAIAKMREWASSLAALSAEEIERFVRAPLEDDKHFTFAWEGGRLVKKRRKIPKTFKEHVDRWLRGALASLTRSEDDSRLGTEDELTLLLVRAGANALRRHMSSADFEEKVKIESSRVAGLNALGSLLPIGRAMARFFINFDTEAGDVRAYLQILTTEEHEEDHKPSINGMLIPLDKEAFEKIRPAFEKRVSPWFLITRLIDLEGYAHPEKETGTHFFAFQYDDWFELFGPTELIDRLIKLDKDSYALLLQLTKVRLCPDPLQRALESVARGGSGAVRTRDWIDRSTVWSLGDTPVDVDSWVSNVRTSAEQVLDLAVRPQRQRVAAQALISALLPEWPRLAHDLVHKSFDELTEPAPDQREAIILQLFKTAQLPSGEPAAGAAAAVLEVCGVPILADGSHGWDVLAAAQIGQ
jgi:hypothetical protein